MYENDDDAERTFSDQRARARGERIRAELRAKLADGPLTATELSPRMPKDVSHSEVAFQLGRLTEEGEAIETRGHAYRLT